jgi:hypothetical protein
VAHRYLRHGQRIRGVRRRTAMRATCAWAPLQRTVSSAIVQSVAMASCAVSSGTLPSQTSSCSLDSTPSFGFGDAPGSIHRLRGSFRSPPSSSGTRWSYSTSFSEPVYPYAAAFSRFSISVMEAGGRIGTAHFARTRVTQVHPPRAGGAGTAVTVAVACAHLPEPIIRTNPRGRVRIHLKGAYPSLYGRSRYCRFSCC